MSLTDPRFDGPGPEARWADMLSDGIFAIQRCGACQSCQFPPVATCQTCGAPDPALIPAEGKGHVYSTTTVRTREGAYDVSIIELAEGPRMMSRVEGPPADTIRIGQPVIARIATQSDGPTVVFDPAEGAA